MADALSGTNGHAADPSMLMSLSNQEKDELIERVEKALSIMATALKASGFSDYEAGSINLQTRFAITSLFKERARRG